MAIRKDSKGKIYEINESKIVPIYATFFVLILTIGGLLTNLDIKEKGQLICFICISALIVGVSFYTCIKGYMSASKLNKVKSFKKNGGGIIKKIKITSIEPYKHSNSGDNRYYLEAKEGEIIYCSNDFRALNLVTKSSELPIVTQSELDKLQSGGVLRVTYKQSEYKPKIYGVIYNGHTIMIGDIITIYIDPDDEKNYRMDIDFLFEK